MADDAPLSDREIEEIRRILKVFDDREIEDLRSILTAHRALMWIGVAVKNLALWLTAVFGAMTAYQKLWPLLTKG